MPGSAVLTWQRFPIEVPFCKTEIGHRVVQYILNLSSARIYGPSFRENKLKTLVFSHRKRAFWVSFRENWHCCVRDRSS
jgi:hypothetical protein